MMKNNFTWKDMEANGIADSIDKRTIRRNVPCIEALNKIVLNKKEEVE
jgi:hypothetical protein